MMRRIMHGNKRLTGQGVRQDQERAEVMMKDVMAYANEKSYNNVDTANKKVQEVMDYYK